MIGRLTGQLVAITDGFVLVDVGGVAYEVEVSSGVLQALPQLNETLVLHTHFVVREDAQLLYGFPSQTERDLFRAFIKLNGVGPKLGLALISALSPADLVTAVRNNDVSMLTRVPGVGKKTAERLLLELKSRVDSLTESGVVPVTVAEVEGVTVHRNGVVEEAESALVALGYRLPEAQRAVGLACNGRDLAGLTAEELVRLALRSFVTTG